MRKVHIYAHRGGCKETVENSWAALEYAKKLGFKYFETDVRATKDNVVVIYHDANLSRLSNVDKSVEQLTWEELSVIGYNDGSQIVRLEDALKKYKDFHFNIDLKDDSVVDPFIDLIKKMPEVNERICVASFSSKRLKLIREVFGSQVKTSMSLCEVARFKIASTLTIPPSLLRVPTNKIGVVAVQVPERFGCVKVVTKRFITACHKRNMKIEVWTVDSGKKIEELIELGVDGIFTDSPSVAKAIMLEHGLW